MDNKCLKLMPMLGLLDAVAISADAIIEAGIFVVIGIAAFIASPALMTSMMIAVVVGKSYDIRNQSWQE